MCFDQSIQGRALGPSGFMSPPLRPTFGGMAYGLHSPAAGIGLGFGGSPGLPGKLARPPLMPGFGIPGAGYPTAPMPLGAPGLMPSKQELPGCGIL
jgi:hypothetical protein